VPKGKTEKMSNKNPITMAQNKASLSPKIKRIKVKTTGQKLKRQSIFKIRL